MFNSTKIKGVIYDHWKIIFPALFPIISSLLLLFWRSFRDLMNQAIPFWLLFLTIVIYSTLIIVVLKRSSNRVGLPQVKLVNNLIYQNEDEQAYCPVCFEQTGILKRMKVHQREYDDLYQCFACKYTETIDH